MSPTNSLSSSDLQRDLLVFMGLRMRVHRIGLAHWQAGARLRSWGVVPLHRNGDELLAPCGAREALWLGFWQDEEDGPGATVELHDRARGASASIVLPPEFQLTALRGADGTAHPIAPPAAHYALALSTGGAQCLLSLQLQPPREWAQAAGRAAPPALTGPPPLPPRYA
ncbi:hypothetical protein [Pseudorhodoferax soli]|uniref:Uncharacterized protein n=1 Tax=Pseudorhodoferax soli TaxID=545864 RepID=A0A368XQ73_9BURK|nr:hypothetical protein [Pseudorhodoferax soli]RCW70162.1 hypothetical protein DES41_105100 [Pseudorhodoferax soli]